MFLLVLVFIFVSMVAGIGEGYRIKDVVKYSLFWHTCQFFERIGFLGAGIFIAFTCDLSFWGIVALSVFFAVLFFLVYDGMINKIMGRNFFFISEDSTAWTEKYAHWWIKIPLVILIAIANILVFKLYSDER